MTAYRRLGHPDLSVNIGYAPYMDDELVHRVFVYKRPKLFMINYVYQLSHHAKIVKTKF